MTIQEKAKDYESWFTEKTRDNGESFILLKDDAPEDITEMIYTCHAGSLPDDWTYKFIRESLVEISDCENPEDIIIESDIYTAELTQWLASRNDRLSYLDEAISQSGNHSGAFDLLSLAQYLEKREIFEMILEHLSALEDVDWGWAG